MKYSAEKPVKRGWTWNTTTIFIALLVLTALMAAFFRAVFEGLGS